MIMGSDCGAPICELLSDNPKECKVVDLCASVGHWYVIHLPCYLTPTGDGMQYVDWVNTPIMVILQGIRDGERVSPCTISWAWSWYVLFWLGPKMRLMTLFDVPLALHAILLSGSPYPNTIPPSKCSLRDCWHYGYTTLSRCISRCCAHTDDLP